MIMLPTQVLTAASPGLYQRAFLLPAIRPSCYSATLPSLYPAIRLSATPPSLCPATLPSRYPAFPLSGYLAIPLSGYPAIPLAPFISLDGPSSVVGSLLTLVVGNVYTRMEVGGQRTRVGNELELAKQRNEDLPTRAER